MNDAMSINVDGFAGSDGSRRPEVYAAMNVPIRRSALLDARMRLLTAEPEGRGHRQYAVVLVVATAFAAVPPP